MSQSPAAIGPDLWRRLDESYQHGDRAAFEIAVAEFRSADVDRVALMKHAFEYGYARYRATAVRMLEYLTPVELEAIFPDLIVLASWAHGGIRRVRDLILSLPRGWVIERIESAAEPLLMHGTDEEYRRFLELYADLDHDLALRLASRAETHPDDCIREVGEEFLEELGIS
jgi:hypothetical protein